MITHQLVSVSSLCSMKHAGRCSWIARTHHHSRAIRAQACATCSPRTRPCVRAHARNTAWGTQGVRACSPLRVSHLVIYQREKYSKNPGIVRGGQNGEVRQSDRR